MFGIQFCLLVYSEEDAYYIYYIFGVQLCLFVHSEEDVYYIYLGSSSTCLYTVKKLIYIYIWGPILPVCQSSRAVWKSRWPSWAPIPNKPTVSVDVKQHSTNHLFVHTEEGVYYACSSHKVIRLSQASIQELYLLTDRQQLGTEWKVCDLATAKHGCQALPAAIPPQFTFTGETHL